MSLTVMEDPRLETVPEEATEEVNVARTTSSGRVSKPPERLGFDVPAIWRQELGARLPTLSTSPTTSGKGTSKKI